MEVWKIEFSVEIPNFCLITIIYYVTGVSYMPISICIETVHY